MNDFRYDQGTMDAMKLLGKTCPYLSGLMEEVQIFQHFFCPISIAEADVREYVVDEYDTVEFLVLRLYDAGIRQASSISQLTGIAQTMIEKILISEKYTFGHIDSETGEVTQAGRATLDENTDMDNLFQHALYRVKREMQVDSITGTLIKARVEKRKGKMPGFNEEMWPIILPRKSVEIDDELNREIRERLQLYIDNGYFTDGNTINSIEQIQTREVRYRDAYFVKIRSFTYPFIALPYDYRDKEESMGKQYVEPICLSHTDYLTIQGEQGVSSCLVREDPYFEYLDSFFAMFEEMSYEQSSNAEGTLDDMIATEESDGEAEKTLNEMISRESELEKMLGEEGKSDDQSMAM